MFGSHNAYGGANMKRLAFRHLLGLGNLRMSCVVNPINEIRSYAGP
jgi:hypothetical protein